MLTRYYLTNNFKKIVLNFCLSLIFLFLSWQFILFKFTFLSNISLLIIFAINYTFAKNVYRRYLLILIFCLSVLLGYSFLMQNEATLSIRFFLIIFFVISSYFINVDYINSNFFTIIVWISLPLCLFVILLEYILFNLDDASISSIRNLVALDAKVGDIYFWKFYYKIQVRGLAILPFIYMLSYVVDVFPLSKKYVFRIIYLLAIFIAGNFAFILAIVSFHIMLYFCGEKSFTVKSLFVKYIISFLLISSMIFVFLPIFLEVMNEKADYSNAIRFEQATLLIKDLNENICTLFLGTGLGNTIDISTHFRDYTGNVYFELQILYFLNQLGVLNFLIFAVANIFLTLKFIPNFKLKITYISYVIYASTNPYILDTTQVFVIIMLIFSQNKLSINKGIHAYT